MNTAPDSPDSNPKNSLPGVVGLIITLVCLVAVFVIVGAVSKAGDAGKLQDLRDTGQEVEAVVISKDLESRVSRRSATLKANFVYEITLNGETRNLEVARDSFAYGTKRVGETELMCVDPENLENVQFEFSECANKLKR